jgi:hypothetical protein
MEEWLGHRRKKRINGFGEFSLGWSYQQGTKSLLFVLVGGYSRDK